MLVSSITELIGRTPILKLDQSVHGLSNIDIYVKLEYFNPFGSLKDRIAWNILQHELSECKGDLREVVELSSGNTAKALAILTGMFGSTFTTVTNRIKVPEYKDLLMLLEATIEELPGLSECPDITNPNDPLTHIQRRLSAKPDRYFHTDQYFNPLNPEAHRYGTGQEILDDLGFAPDYFVVGLGTSGTSMGTADTLKKANPRVETIGVVAAKSDFIPGIRTIDEMYEVGLFKPENFKNIEVIDSGTALDAMKVLAMKAGVLGGPTTGSTFAGALSYLRQTEQFRTERQTAVFIACDRVEPYMSYVRKRRPEWFGEKISHRDVRSLTPAQTETAHELSPNEAREWIATTNPLVIDLRGPLAYKALHIAGSINIRDSVFSELIRDELPFEKEQPVLLTCPVGEQSKMFAALLNGLGCADVRSLKGGVVAWRDENLELVRST